MLCIICGSGTSLLYPLTPRAQIYIHRLCLQQRSTALQQAEQRTRPQSTPPIHLHYHASAAQELIPAAAVDLGDAVADEPQPSYTSQDHTDGAAAATSSADSIALAHPYNTPDYFGFKVGRVIAAGLGANGYQVAIVQSGSLEDKDNPIVIYTAGPNQHGQLAISYTNPEYGQKHVKCTVADRKAYKVAFPGSSQNQRFVSTDRSTLPYYLNNGHEVITLAVGSAHAFIVTKKDDQFHYWGVGANDLGQLMPRPSPFAPPTPKFTHWTYLNLQPYFKSLVLAKIKPGTSFEKAVARGAGTELTFTTPTGAATTITLGELSETTPVKLPK